MAGPFPYHLRYHSDILGAYIGMPLELRGAYDTLLELLYERMKPLPNDAKFLSGWLQCSTRKTQSLIEDLIKRGKIYITNSGELSNERFDIEAQNREDWSKKSSKAAAKKWRNYREMQSRSNENNNLTDANFKNGNAIKRKIEKEKENISPLNPPLGENRQSTKRGTRIPDNFRPSEEVILRNLKRGLNPETVEIEIEKMNSWAKAASGAKGIKRDWDQFANNWFITATERQKANGQGRNGQAPEGSIARGFANLRRKLDEYERDQGVNGYGGTIVEIFPRLQQGE